MEARNLYALCLKDPGGSYRPLITGQVNAAGMYQLIMTVNQFRSVFSDVFLVINDHLVISANVTRDGMQVRGTPLEVF